MQQRANEFIMADPDTQAEKVIEAQQQVQQPVSLDEEMALAPTE